MIGFIDTAACYRNHIEKNQIYEASDVSDDNSAKHENMDAVSDPEAMQVNGTSHRNNDVCQDGFQRPSSASSSSASGDVDAYSDRSGDETPPRVHASLVRSDDEQDQNNQIFYSESAEADGSHRAAFSENRAVQDDSHQTVVEYDKISSPPVPRPEVKHVTAPPHSPEGNGQKTFGFVVI